MPKSRCPLCRASMDVQCQSITNIGALDIAWKLYRLHKRERVRVIDLPDIDKYSGYRNFQKLPYFKIISKPTRDGLYNVTPFGELFLLNRLPVRRRAWTFHNRVVARGGELIYVNDIKPDRVWDRDDYAKHAKPQGWDHLNLYWAQTPERWEEFRQALLGGAAACETYFADYDDDGFDDDDG